MLNPNVHVLDFVDAYLHDLLTPGESVTIARHCEQCPICQVALIEARKRYEALQSLPSAPVSPRLLRSVERKLSLRSRQRFTARQFALAGAAAAALLIGCCHLYFLTLTPSSYELRVLGQSELLPGSEASLRVLMVNKHTGQPLGGVPVSIELCGLDGNNLMTLASAVTDRSGTIAPRLRWPGWQDGDYELRVTARPGFAEERITRSVKLRRKWQLLLSSDKPVYQPGQTIHLRSLALARPDLVPVAGREMSFSISDPKGNKIFRQRQVTSRFGIAFTECALADEITEGAYQVQCEVGDTQSSLTVEVRKYVLPKFKLQVALDRPYYEPGQRLSGTIQADYFFGQPVAGGEVRVELRGKDGDTAALATVSVHTDASGKAAFEFLLPTTLAGQPQHGGDAPIAIVAAVQDTAGQQQSKTVSTIVTAQPIHIEVLPETGRLVRGVANTIYILTSYPDGQPAKTRIAVSGLDHELNTSDLGLASMEFTPRADTNRWVVRASDQAGLTGLRELQIPIGQAGDDFLIRTNKAVYTGGETMEVLALAPGEEPVFLDLIKDGQTMLTTSMEVSAGRGRYELDLPAELFGAVELCAYRYDAGGLPTRKTRVIYIRQARAVRIATAQDRPEYRPGERATLKFTLTDEQGRPAPGALGLAAVDEAVFSVLQPMPGLRATFSALEEQLLKPVYQIYDWSPDFGSRGSGFPGAEKPSRADRQRFEQALFAATAGAGDKNLQDELLPYLENDRSLFDVLDRPDWEELAESMQMSKQTIQLLRERGRPYSLMADSFAAKQLATEAHQRDGLKVVKMAWMLFGMFCVLPTIIWILGRSTFLQVAALICVLFVLIALMLPAVQAAREASRRNQASNSLKQLGLGLQSHHDTMRVLPVGEAPPTRLRQWFPEVLLWRPELITDDRGQATLEIDLADSITTWRLSASAVTAGGQLGAAEHSIRVFQPFFVDLDLPQSLTRGDEVTLPVVVYNYLDQPQTVELRMAESPGIELLDEAMQRLELAPGEVRAGSYRLRASRVGRQTIEVHATSGEIADAVRREIEVVPEGQRVEQVFSGKLGQPVEIELSVPEAAIEGSAQTLLKIYPSSFSQLVEGLDAIFQQPYGCFEQTSSTTYPNILALDYLLRTRQSAPAVEAKARQYIHLGYQRLLSFEITGGGFDWFGYPPANHTLTAYGLLEFVDMAKVHDVDPQLIARTRRWLLAQQRPDGSWSPESHRLHEDPTRRQDDLARLSTTAYVAGAVFAGQSVSRESQAALNFLLVHTAGTIDDAYVLALTTQAIGAIDPGSNGAAAYLDRLNSLRQISPDGKRAWWQLNPLGETTFYGSGRSGDIETTALAALALIEAGRYPDTSRAALAWLIEQKDARGTWHSTQATVLALKALLAATGKPLGGESARHIEVAVDGRNVEQISIPSAEFDVMRQVDLTAHVGAGSHRLTLTDRSGTAAGYQVVARHHVPQAASPRPAQPLSIRLAYDRGALTVGDTLVVTATVVNNLAAAAPMVVLDLPIPAGFTVQAEACDNMVLEGKIAKYQLTPRSVIVYLRELEPAGPVELTYRLQASMPVSVTARGAIAYEYYNPDVHTQSGPTLLTVGPR